MKRDRMTKNRQNDIKAKKRKTEKKETEWHKDNTRGKTIQEERQNNKRDKVTGKTERIKTR